MSEEPATEAPERMRVKARIMLRLSARILISIHFACDEKSAASLDRVLGPHGFRMFAREAQNGFVGRQICVAEALATKQLPRPGGRQIRDFAFDKRKLI